MPQYFPQYLPLCFSTLNFYFCYVIVYQTKTFYEMTRFFSFLALAAFLTLSITACKKQKSSDPSITSVFPSSAYGGDTITLRIKDFPRDLSGVKFTINKKAATIITTTTDTIQVIVPLKSGSGAVEANINGRAYSGPQFTYKRRAIVTTVAGSGNAGNYDGSGNNAYFNCPWGIATGDNGDLFIADSYNRLIRKISGQTGNVSTFPIPILLNGKSFYSPNDIALDPVTHDLYVTDFNKHVMRMDSSGNTSVIFEDQGPLTGIAISPDRKNLYISNNSLGTITRTDIDGSNPMVVSSGLYTPRNIIFDATGRMYVAAYPAGIYLIPANGKALPVVSAPDFHGWEIAKDTSGNFYFADHFSNNIQMSDKNGILTVIAGSGAPADIDGTGLQASFNGPMGLAIDKDGNLYVSTYNFDTQGGNKIRKITFQ
jgi:sugar lactone lactonase YvrE